MDKKLNFMKKAFAWTAIVSAIAFVIVGIVSPIEDGMSLFGHVLKTIFMWAWVTVALETIMYTLGQFIYHWMDDYKEKYGSRWFIEGIKEDFRYIKEVITWEKVLKTVCVYIMFFAVCLIIFGALEYLVP